MKDKQAINITEAAKYLGVHRSTLYRWVKNPEVRAKLGAYKLIGSLGSRFPWRFKVGMLELFLKGNGQVEQGLEANAREKIIK